MITIETYRFVIEPESVKTLFTVPRPVVEAYYHAELDRRPEHLAIGQCDLQRALRCAKLYLKNHYGYVKIYLDVDDEYAKPPRPIKLCNHRRFWRDMVAKGTVVKLHKEKEIR